MDGASGSSVDIRHSSLRIGATMATRNRVVLGSTNWRNAAYRPRVVDIFLRVMVIALALKRAAAVSCRDEYDGVSCIEWAKSGECERNPNFMKRNCAASCDSCGWEGDESCKSRASSVPVVHAGDISRIFERARAMEWLKPKVWSSDPWVMTFDDFVSEAEAQAFIDTCHDGFQRSLAGDVVSPVRTSDQAWCSTAPCLENPLVEAVQQRVANVTGIPPQNAEFFQVVRYREGQFYKLHHDQNTHPDTHSGVRLLTFFIYLFEPLVGGETRFPRLNITIPPRHLSALLWPNVLDRNPRASDLRTEHEAMPPTAGVKFAANLWLHQFDFRTPNTHGCDMDKHVASFTRDVRRGGGGGGEHHSDVDDVDVPPDRVEL